MLNKIIMKNYRSIKSKERFYKKLYHKIDTLPELQEFMDEARDKRENNIKDVLYRGLPEALYKIYSSLQREWIGNNIKQAFNNISCDEFIKKMIKNVQNDDTLNRYYKSMRFVQNDWNALCFLQHYGAPTPMVDFTYKLDVALFSGIKDYEQSSDSGSGYFSVYKIKEKDVNKMDKILLDNKIVNREDLRDSDIKSLFSDILYDNISKYRSKEKPILCDASAGHIKSILKNGGGKIDCDYYVGNLNMSAQDGALLFLNNEQHPLEESMKGKIEVYDINKSLCKYIRDYLCKQCITADTLFPNQNAIAQKAFRSIVELK